MSDKVKTDCCCHHSHGHDECKCTHHSHNEHSHSSCHGHSCGCACGDGGEVNSSLLFTRLAAGFLFSIISILINNGISVYGHIIAYLIMGYDVLYRAVKNILKGRIFDENFLMSLATVGAVILGEYTEAAAVMFFYQIGEFLSANAVMRSKNSIMALMDSRPDTARLITQNGLVETACEKIKPGDKVLISAGEKVPVDGVITKGCASLDTSSMTGESAPVTYNVGDTVLAGMICCDFSIEVEVTKEYNNTTFAKILDIAKHSQEKKASTERFITSFARVYTPIVVFVAVFVAVIPPLAGFGTFSEWITKALNFLVISCPCALVVSVPLSFFAGIGRASKSGILIKNAKALENLSRIKTVAFDKTGTITKGSPQIVKIRANGSKAELLMACAYAEADSTHPIANAIREKFKELSGENIDRSVISYIKEIPGKGVEAKIGSDIILAGRYEFLAENGIAVPGDIAEAVYVAKNSVYFGHIIYSDIIKPEAEEAVSKLHALGADCVILSGDSESNVQTAAQSVGIKSFYSRLLPHEKSEIIENLKKNGAVLFAGDGINDAPSLATATVGAAMGGAGSDAAIESGDIVIMGDKLTHLANAIKISKSVMRRVYENVAVSIGIKLAVMVISLFGSGGMWPAIFADVGVLVITVANSLRHKNTD